MNFECAICGASYESKSNVGTLNLAAVPDELVTDKNHPFLLPGFYLRCSNWTECGERHSPNGVPLPMPPSAMNNGGTLVTGLTERMAKRTAT
jgi:hypothetical protein